MTDKSNHITRRTFLWRLSALAPALGLVTFGERFVGGLNLAKAAAPTAAATIAPTALACIASPSMTEGPYFVDEMLKRVDIRTDPTDNSVKPGVPLRLTIKVYSVNGSTCAPLKNAQIDIWHCDAAGSYSDESANNTQGKKFLRGYQVTDDSGSVTFTTIYPGWYRGRTVHIHVKVRTFAADGTSNYAFNSQLFFDDALNDSVQAQAPYNTNGKRDTTNLTDMVYTGQDATGDDVGSLMLLTLTKDADGYVSNVNMGVDLSTPSVESNGGPGGGPPPNGGPGEPPPGSGAGRPSFSTPPATAVSQ